MKLFTKVALVSAVAISSNAMAMQAMDDAALSATTGQDGISIGIDIDTVNISKLHVFDGDGLPTAQAGLGGTGTTGAITVNDVVLQKNANTLASGNLADVAIDTDGGSGSPFLNVAASVAGLDIDLGKIEVNDATGAAGAYKVGTASATILSGLTLSTGSLTANIQLGNTPQGAMIKLNGTMTGGLAINNLALKDEAAGGYIAIGGIKISDTGNANSDLALDADIAVKPEGLAITALKGTTGTDIYIKQVVLGGGAGYTGVGMPVYNATVAGSGSIGDVAISGMTITNSAGAGAVIKISGH
ncbi:DUF6160 family protein [Acinetobacter sp. CFCC 10889]|uniref:putative pilus system protein FilA n=1 Tax=Acinetobacter sp. CFCC 10889 TaxID=1775557 RepID=UPI000DD083AC|nr:DUF6160 family protein [Acinetobacter sp. CFCC 10889]